MHQGSSELDTGYLIVGNEGTGTLSISNGGVVNGTCFIGYKNSSDGAVTVRGAGSVWNNDSSLSVGYDGTGTLSISNGGMVR